MPTLPRSSGLLSWIPLSILLAFALPAQTQGPDSVAERLMSEAERHAERGDVQAAVVELRSVVERLPESPAAPAALLRAAELLWEAERPAEARAALVELEAAYPDTVDAARGAVLGARLEMASVSSREQLQRIHSDLRRIATLYPPHQFPELDARLDARLLAARIALLIDRPDWAAEDYLAVLESERRSAATARARLGFSEIVLQGGDWIDAAAELQRLKQELEGAEWEEAPALLELARSRLTLIHRLEVRPSRGDLPWLEAREIELEESGVQRPTGIAARGERVLVSEARQAVLHLVSSESGEVTTLPGLPGQAPFFDFDGDGWIVTGEGVQGLDGTRLSGFARPDGKERTLSKIVAAARDQLGNWYLVDRDLSGLGAFDRQGRPLTRVGVEGLREIIDLVYDRSGRSWVLDARTSQVVRFGSDLEVEGRFALEARRPVAIDVDPLGQLYVLDAATSTVAVYRPDGSLRHRLGADLLAAFEPRRLDDLSVDGRGRIFLLENRVPRILVLE